MARLATQHFWQAGRRGLGWGNNQVVRIHFQKGTNHKNLTRIILISISGSAKSAISMKTDFLENHNVFCPAEYVIFFDKKPWLLILFVKIMWTQTRRNTIIMILVSDSNVLDVLRNISYFLVHSTRILATLLFRQPYYWWNSSGQMKTSLTKVRL